MSGATSEANPFGGLAREWARLAAWLASAGSLPLTEAAFAARYGAFDDTAEVGRFVAAVAAVAALAKGAGGPAALKRALVDNPGLLSDASPPAALYDWLVWMTPRVGDTARTAALTFDQLPALLAAGNGGVAERAENLKSVLAGPGGLVENFGQARSRTAALAAALTAFADSAAPLARQLAATKLINQANVVIGGLESANRHLAAPVAAKRPGLFSRGEAGASDPASGQAAQIAANTREIARKQALIDDSAALLAASERVGGAGSAVAAVVSALALRFQRAANQLVQFCAISAPDQLGDAGWVAQALDPTALAAGWRALADAAQAFAASALIDPAAGRLS